MSTDQPPAATQTLTTLLHRLRNLLIRALLRALRLFSPSIDRLLVRLAASPGLPVPAPTEAYWQIPEAPVARCGQHDAVPAYADVVVVGSGITGTSFARTLLDWERAHRGEGVRVVMLEAREACSGATGRNGGHITPVLYEQYPELREAFGAEMAARIIRFRLAHIPALLEAAREEGLLEESQCRRVDAFDVFMNKEQFAESKRKLEVYSRALPEESGEYRVREGPEAIKELELNENAAGCISTRAGAVHPYRLVTGILARLVREYPSTFRLLTRTPCTGVRVAARDGVELYEVATPRGTIRTAHVVHATNGWAGHLLPGMRGKIVPARGTMTAQTVENASWAGERSFVFFPGRGTAAFDYLTQQPVGRGGEGEMMLGGAYATGDVIEEVGNADDAGWDGKAGAYLCGALAGHFGAAGRVRRLWSGVLGISVDGQPWVGRVPGAVAGRGAPRWTEIGGSKVRGGLAAAGEWMACGYSGEGMVHAWLSGKAVAHMVLGLDAESGAGTEKVAPAGGDEPVDSWLPGIYRVDEKRWARARTEDLIAWFVAL